jgi:hypothetical protein
LVARSEFTTPHGKLLRETSLPHGMENSPTTVRLWKWQALAGAMKKDYF